MTISKPATRPAFTECEYPKCTCPRHGHCQIAMADAKRARPFRPYPELLELRSSLKAMLGLFDDEGNMIATFVEMQNAINEGYEVLGRSLPSYEVSADYSTERSPAEKTGESASCPPLPPL